MKTPKLRIRDKHANRLERLSRLVNFVYNYVNSLNYKCLRCTNKFFSACDINQYTKGGGGLLGLHSQTSQVINQTYTKSRKQFKKDKLAKSVYDAGWFELKRQLKYKCEHAGCRLEKVNESYTTQTCSCCGNSASSAKVRVGLRVREWVCAKCGTAHDRDVNAAKNILALGLERLVVGIP